MASNRKSSRTPVDDSLDDEARLFEDFQELLSQRIPYLLRVTHHAFLRSLDKRLRKYGITLSMWYHLRALWHRDGLTQSQLTQIVGVTGPATVNIVNKLEAEGLVKRRRNKGDKRKINVFLTKKGKEMEDEINYIADEVQNIAIEDISFEDRQIFMGVLSRMLKSLYEDTAAD